MNRSNRLDLVRTTLGLTVALTLSGCAASGGGGGGDGGGGDTDPFPNVQVGTDAELDANLAATADATAQAKVCLGDERDRDDLTPTDAQVLDVLKREYDADTTVSASLEDYVAQTAELEQARATEICDTTLETTSEELRGLVTRLTTAGNDAHRCDGTTANETDEVSLQALKAAYLVRRVQEFSSLTEFATAYIAEIERALEETCAD